MSYTLSRESRDTKTYFWLVFVVMASPLGRSRAILCFFDQVHRYHRNDHLDILAKEAGMEAKPVGRDIEPTMEKEVSLEGTGTHFEDHLLQRDIFKQLVVLLVVFAP